MIQKNIKCSIVLTPLLTPDDQRAHFFLNVENKYYG